MVKSSISARSPLSPTLWPREAFTWWKSLLFAVLVFTMVLVTVTFAFGVALGFGLATMKELQTLSWPLLFAQLFSYAAVLAVIAAVLPALAQRPLRELGLRAPRLSDLAWGTGGVVAMIAAVALAASLQERFVHFKADQVQVQWLRAAHGPLLAGFAFLACVAAPFFEETVFRGFIFNALLRYLTPWGAVVISALVFGLFHLLEPGNSGAVFPLAAGGVVLALVYYRSGSLVASMLTHALFNAATFVAVSVFHQKP